MFLSGCLGADLADNDKEAVPVSVYEITVKGMKNEDVPFSAYKGKVLLIVNTATLCGFTPQYPGLQALYAKYKDKGFEILDFPCNQFLNQAPGTIDEIHATCTTRFGITFTQFAKIDVNGKNESPLYKFLKVNSNGKNIGWNFTKFLVDREGKVVKRFEPADKPESIDPEIAALLK
jgi:glutathione peroxidase